ncbi:serine/threonine-protein kinase-like protein CR4 [Selaginella moellendorffii]|uniref:serine/threonine-protein kinase-like protein CR4 n=1 Tax=Selaginella moellendorffii TaxID=88036 RepID=UPI000D1CADCC|nr:serine/threonine-protein kinase-like protein CR4 [Selaginella moellendorffii]|eukprot:XP_024536743.1 serine/threonine-protein kinase-like protein CR4 [Selaginella moellendorffii]
MDARVYSISSTAAMDCCIHRDDEHSGTDVEQVGQSELGRQEFLRAVLARGGNTHAIVLSGKLDCWGSNVDGELDVQKNRSFVMVSSGYGYTCGLIKTGEAFCWGWDAPVRSLPSGITFGALFSGGTHACGLVKNSSAPVCWGYNDHGQVQGRLTIQAFCSLALGLFHSCGIVKDTGNVVCWGDNAFNQTDAPEGEAFSVISAGDYYTCGVSLKDPERVKCWGNSVDFAGASIRVTQGLCTSDACSKQQYQLLQAGSKRCPVAGDRVCLECLRGSKQCTGREPTKLHDSRNLAVGFSMEGIFILGAAAFTAGYFLRRRPKRPFQCGCLPWRGKPSTSEEWEILANRLVTFSSSEIIHATKGYYSDMIVAKGASGVVYKAVLPLALKKSRAGDKSLMKELSLLARSPHLSRELGGILRSRAAPGFRVHGERLALRLPFQEARDQAGLLRENSHRSTGSSRTGLLTQVCVSRNTPSRCEAANILLEGDWNAHLSDFGFSLSTSGSSTRFMTMVGTRGYMEPECKPSSSPPGATSTALERCC